MPGPPVLLKNQRAALLREIFTLSDDSKAPFPMDVGPHFDSAKPSQCMSIERRMNAEKILSDGVKGTVPK